MKKMFVVAVIIGLSGCAGRVVDWAKETVNQGIAMPDFLSVPRSYIRSIAIYDQFDTKARFCALWLSDAVRTSYAQLIAYKQGKNDEQKNVFMRRQLAENEHFIMFYLLSLYEVPLRDKDGLWNFFLEIDGSAYAPVEVKVIELAAEYQIIFGERYHPQSTAVPYNEFKVPYLVTFNARDIENRPLITATTKTIALVFRSVKKEGRLMWNLCDFKKEK